jgi:hypothetical protein
MTSIALPLTERDFMAQVTQLAELFGWQWAHFRPAMTTKGWRTPVSGPLGKGWPDLVLVRPPRLIFAELKRDGGKLAQEQADVLSLLGRFMVEVPEIPDDFPIPRQRSYLDGVFTGPDKALHDGPKIDVVVWHPRDWEQIEDALR